MPHTHDDTGWLDTVDGYYVNQVQWILSTLMPALESSRTSEGWPQRKFSYVEVSSKLSFLRGVFLLFTIYGLPDGLFRALVD